MSLSIEAIDKMKVEELKAELKVRSKSVVGKKADLYARLLEAVKEGSSIVGDENKTSLTFEPQENVFTSRAEIDSEKSAVVTCVSNDLPDVLKKEETVAEKSEVLACVSNNLPDSHTNKGEFFAGNSDVLACVSNELSDIHTNKKETVTGESEVLACAPNDLPFPSLETISHIVPTTSDAFNVLSHSVEVNAKSIYTEEQSAVEVKGSDSNVDESDETNHVRIDNFQRPLNHKALLEWLVNISGIKISPEDLWINGIKTHCYVDFDNVADAKTCINVVKGEKWPLNSTSTNAIYLDANFTGVSAKMAPESTEAKLAPKVWRLKAAPTNLAAGTPPVVCIGASGSILDRVKPLVESLKRQREEEKQSANKKGDKSNSSNFVGEEPVDLDSLSLLFRKTQTTPHLYWLPLTLDQVNEKKRKGK